MIQPSYVTFEQARLLKEKGFHEVCDHYYKHALTESYNEQDGYEGPFGWEKGETNLHRTGIFVNNSSYDFSNNAWYCCAAPEQWQVVEWLRVKYGIWINVSSHSSGYYYPKLDICSDKAWDNYDFRNKRLGINRKLFEYRSPQEAYSAAFDHILNELI